MKSHGPRHCGNSCEETNIRSVHRLGEIAEWLKYDIPRDLLGQAWQGRYRGQMQKWFAMRFTGAETEIDVAHPDGAHEPEFSDWRWEPLQNIPDLVVPFKRAVYERVAAEFKKARLTFRGGRGACDEWLRNRVGELLYGRGRRHPRRWPVCWSRSRSTCSAFWISAIARTRAEMLIMLVGALLACSFGLIPGQPLQAFGSEILGAGLLMTASPIVIQARQFPLMKAQPLNWWLWRQLIALCAGIPVLIGGLLSRRRNERRHLLAGGRRADDHRRHRLERLGPAGRDFALMRAGRSVA